MLSCQRSSPALFAAIFARRRKKSPCTSRTSTKSKWTSTWSRRATLTRSWSRWWQTLRIRRREKRSRCQLLRNWPQSLTKDARSRPFVSGSRIVEIFFCWRRKIRVRAHFLSPRISKYCDREFPAWDHVFYQRHLEEHEKAATTGNLALPYPAEWIVDTNSK